VIWDSGATDNVTGDLYALHEFTTLKKPIAVRVATDGPSTFITGTGTLKFRRMNGTIIAVKRVYYCERSRSTLLSIAAFKKSHGIFRVNGNFNSINLLSKSGTTLLCSTFDPDTKSWPLAKPLRAPITIENCVPEAFMIDIES
jgi:hypothetical protein